jgi:ferrochelatase
LLINLGSPDAPDAQAVRAYLKEFLSDPRVMDIGAWTRAMVLNLFILPFRPEQSAQAYRQIWGEDGSPLIHHGMRLAAKVQHLLGETVRVELAMRYGKPSIAAALKRLHQEGIDRIAIFPLYPQYSSATTGSTVEAVYRLAAVHWTMPTLQVIPSFFDHEQYIDAFAAVAEPILGNDRFERVLFSFHGLPQRHCLKSDDSGEHCLRRDDCCEKIVLANRHCYRAQCFATMKALSARLQLPPHRVDISFQSRLGREPWIGPYTDERLEELAARGVKRIAVISPAFVADCLETLEELGIRAKAQWHALGGEQFTLVPSLNSCDRWAAAVAAIAREHVAWLRSAAESPATR